MAQHAVYRDEAKLIQTAKEAAEDLKRLFEADAARRGEPVAAAEPGAEPTGKPKRRHPNPAKQD
jgi:hypothetical protein